MYGTGDGSGEVRVREARITKPHSPSLQETHRLYRYDKVIASTSYCSCSLTVQIGMSDKDSMVLVNGLFVAVICSLRKAVAKILYCLCCGFVSQLPMGPFFNYLSCELSLVKCVMQS